MNNIQKYKYLFGPVNSRRLGVSLGVDLAPRKVCTLDCVYCEVGATTLLTMERKEYAKYDKVVSELEDYLSKFPKPDFITITGSGEPTLNIRFGDVISFIKTHHPEIKVAVLTNGTLMHLPEVRKEMLNADLVMPSLDAVSVEAFQKIDKPENSIDIQQYIDGIATFSKEFSGELALEVLLLEDYNFSDYELDLLREAIIKINPHKVQLNTLDRPGVIENLRPLSSEQMQYAVDYINLPNVEIIARNLKKSTESPVFSDFNSAIIELLKRRPCTLEDIVSVINIDKEVAKRILKSIIEEGRVEEISSHSGIFYKFKVYKK